MQWLRIPVQLMESEASNEALGIWMRLALYFAAMEQRQVCLPTRRPRAWPIDDDEYQILLDSELIDEGGHIICSPDDDIAAVQAAREGGKKGGRPPKNPRVKPPGITLGENPQPKPDKISEAKRSQEKQRGDERSGAADAGAARHPSTPQAPATDPMTAAMDQIERDPTQHSPELDRPPPAPPPAKRERSPAEYAAVLRGWGVAMSPRDEGDQLLARMLAKEYGRTIVRDAVVELRASEGKVWLSRLAEYLADAAMEAEQAPPVHQGPMVSEKRQRDQEAARARLAVTGGAVQ
jgi:hypothetical protein